MFVSLQTYQLLVVFRMIFWVCERTFRVIRWVVRKLWVVVRRLLDDLAIGVWLVGKLLLRLARAIRSRVDPFWKTRKWIRSLPETSRRHGRKRAFR
jgi:hypothetical protein